ncbi:MAG: hypothetical protein JO114_09705 [Planctomycetaceae bacterium]|nr:hypothetical protein [Planctomycetaceae bacterium]
MAGTKDDLPAAELIAGECLGVRVRTLNRALTALYDETLRPHGLRVGQLNLLVAVGRCFPSRGHPREARGMYTEQAARVMLRAYTRIILGAGP